MYKDVPEIEYVKCLSSIDTSLDILEMRARVALKHFKYVSHNDDAYIITVDCACNVAFIFEKILNNSYRYTNTVK